MVFILDKTLRYNIGPYHNIYILRSILLAHSVISEINIFESKYYISWRNFIYCKIRRTCNWFSTKTKKLKE